MHVSPGAVSSEMCGIHGGAIKVRLAAPPVDGRANEALVAFMATSLGVPGRDVTIVRGSSGRRKLVDVQGVDVGTVERWLKQGADRSG